MVWDLTVEIWARSERDKPCDEEGKICEAMRSRGKYTWIRALNTERYVKGKLESTWTEKHLTSGSWNLCRYGLFQSVKLLLMERSLCNFESYLREFNSKLWTADLGTPYMNLFEVQAHRHIYTKYETEVNCRLKRFHLFEISWKQWLYNGHMSMRVRWSWYALLNVVWN